MTSDGGPTAGARPLHRRAHALLRRLGMLLLMSSCTAGEREADSAGASETIAAAFGDPVVAPRVAPAAYAGSAECRSCHASQFTAWSGSTHGDAGRASGGGDANSAGGARVIAPFDGTPLRFRDAVVVPQSRAGAYSFLVQRAGERDTVLLVDAVIGGGHMAGGGTQGFVTRAADGTMRFLPFDWSRQSATWFCNTATRAGRGWQPITRSLRLSDCGDWPPSRVLGDEPRFSNCQGCHASQLEIAFDTTAGRWNTRHNGFAINCESCHGPAARHVALMRTGSAPTADIGLVALGTVDKERSLSTCLGCHALKERLGASTAGGIAAGAALTDAYSLRLPQLYERPLTPDGRTRTFAYQEGHLASDCYRNGGMTCTSCHDPHTQGYRTVDGTPIPGRTDDRQCTSCHASKTLEPSRHTKHAVNSVGSRCVSCHMPYRQQHELGTAIRYARSDHSIAIPRPVLDSSLGLVSACRACHAGVSETTLARQVGSLWGQLKPHESAVAGVLAADGVADATTATPLLLRPESRNATAQVAGLASWLERFARPDMASVPPEFETRVRGLAHSVDPDVRALALALLHYTRGNDPGTRRFLVASARDAGVGATALARRWSRVLGGVGDVARLSGDPASAVTAYRKALEVAPRETALRVNLGLALSAAGDLPAAVSTYQDALRLDAWQPVAEVNLGIALEQSGDVVAARDAYRRAIARDPGAALGYLNMGTSLLREGGAAAAIPYLRRAVARDAGLATAHFQLALALLGTGDQALAESSVRRALALDSGNVEARRLQDALRAARTIEPAAGAAAGSRPQPPR